MRFTEYGSESNIFRGKNWDRNPQLPGNDQGASRHGQYPRTQAGKAGPVFHRTGESSDLKTRHQEKASFEACFGPFGGVMFKGGK